MHLKIFVCRTLRKSSNLVQDGKNVMLVPIIMFANEQCTSKVNKGLCSIHGLICNQLITMDWLCNSGNYMYKSENRDIAPHVVFTETMNNLLSSVYD